MNKWAIIAVDSINEFVDLASIIVRDMNLHDVEFYDSYDEAQKQFDDIKGIISNVYLVKVIDCEVNI